MIIECIKEGFHITHRNWQVMLLKIAVTIVNLVGLFFFVGIPIAAAVVFMSVDIANIKDILPGIMSENPLGFLSKYLGLIVLMLISLILYLTIASVLMLYVFGGTLGVLRNAALNIQYKFSFPSFFKEAKKLFFPLLWLFSIALLVITVVIIVFGIVTGVAFFVIQVLSGGSETTLSVFVVSFFTLLIVFLSLIIGFASVIFTAYVAITLVVEKKKVIDSFKKAWDFVKNKPMAFLFYIILVSGIMGVNILLVLLGGSFQMIPMISILISIPYQLIAYAVQIYLNVVMWSSLVVFYVKGVNYSVYTATYDI